MNAIAIQADSRQPGQCRSCGAALEWAVTMPNRKRMPFNPPIVMASLDANGIGWVDMEQTSSHFATCPQAGEWRRRFPTKKKGGVTHAAI